jgi:hypothetical protein
MLLIGTKNPNFGKENFTWKGWLKGGRPWRWDTKSTDTSFGDRF